MVAKRGVGVWGAVCFTKSAEAQAVLTKGDGKHLG
jgi:hypothetical protein